MNTEIITPYNRLLNLMDYYSLNPNAFAKRIGLKRTQNLYDIRDEKVKKISFELAEKIVTEFPEINMEYLLTGRGTILISEPATNSRSNANIVNMDPISSVAVPYYDVDFAGGWRSEELFTTVRPTSIISAQEFIRAEFACNLVGQSISRRIPSGSVIGLREIFDWQTYFPTNEFYGVVMKNQLRTVKIVKRSKDNPNVLLLLPDPKPEHNTTGYDLEEVPIDFIERFYQVVAWACFEQLAM